MELFIHILEFLTLPDLRSLAACCSTLRSLVREGVKDNEGIKRRSAKYVLSWGDPSENRLGRETDSPYVPTTLLTLSSQVVIHLDSCGSRNIVCTKSGRAYTWGGETNSSWSLFRSSYFGGDRVVQVTCGGECFMALTSSGKVFSWGRGKYSQLGHGHSLDVQTPTLIEVITATMQQQQTNYGIK